MVEASYGPVNVEPVFSTPKPARDPAVWLPWPLQSRGLGSGTGTEAGFCALYASPAKSNPPLTFGAAGPNKAGMAGAVLLAFAAFQAATVPGPPKSAGVYSTPVSMMPSLLPEPVSPERRH